VGAALLVPAAGLTTLGVETAGASTTTLNINSVSTLTFGSLGSATLAGKVAPETGSTTHYLLKKTTAGHTLTQIPIITPTNKGAALLVTTNITFVITHSGTTITGVKINKVTQIVLKIGTTKCSILTIPSITFTATGTKWKAGSTSMTGVTVKSTTCTHQTAIQTEIQAGSLTGSLTLSLI
jgi:hypothetical protein